MYYSFSLALFCTHTHTHTLSLEQFINKHKFESNITNPQLRYWHIYNYNTTFIRYWHIYNYNTTFIHAMQNIKMYSC